MNIYIFVKSTVNTYSFSVFENDRHHVTISSHDDAYTGYYGTIKMVLDKN